MSTAETEDQWQRERKQTIFVIIFHRFSAGLEHAILLATIWYYIKLGLFIEKKDHNLYYGLLHGGRFVATFLFAIPFGKWIDKNRKLKESTIVISFIILVGYIVYVLPYSPALPVVGAICAGFGLILTITFNAEIMRIYPASELQRKYLLPSIAYGVGVMVGPFLAQLLEHHTFTIGTLNITYGNKSCLFLIITALIRFILACTVLHNVSGKYDLKMATVHPQVNGRSKESWSFSIDLTLLLVIQAYFGFWESVIIRCLPFVVDTFNFDHVQLNYTISGTSVFLIITSVIMIYAKQHAKGAYVSGIVALILLFVLNTTLRLVSEGLSDELKYVLLLLLSAAFGSYSITQNVFVTLTLGNSFVSHHQSFIEAMRMSSLLAGKIIGGYLSAYIYDYYLFVFMGNSIIYVIFFILVIARWKTLMHPKINVEDESSPLMEED